MYGWEIECRTILVLETRCTNNVTLVVWTSSYTTSYVNSYYHDYSCGLFSTDCVPSGDTDCLLLQLVQLSMHVVDRYVLTSQAQSVVGDDPVSEHEGYITDIQLSVPCERKQDLSFQLLRQMEPPAFSVTLSGYKITTPIDLEDLDAKEEIRFDYSFPQCYWLRWTV